MGDDQPIELRRVHDALRQPPEGGRVFLVDRLWPRGVRKVDLRFDAWLKDAAPSPELRGWFGHDPGRWEGFVERYQAELDDRPETLRPILDALREGPVTLLYAAKDTDRNHAVVLRDHLARLRASGEGA